jgi:hypothetical protein
MENYINELNIKDKKVIFFKKNIKVDCSNKLTSILKPLFFHNHISKYFHDNITTCVFNFNSQLKTTFFFGRAT